MGEAVHIILSATGTLDTPLFLLVPPPRDITRLPCEKLPAGSLPDNQKKAPKSHTALLCRSGCGVRALSPGALAGGHSPLILTAPCPAIWQNTE